MGAGGSASQGGLRERAAVACRGIGCGGTPGTGCGSAPRCSAMSGRTGAPRTWTGDRGRGGRGGSSAAAPARADPERGSGRGGADPGRAAGAPPIPGGGSRAMIFSHAPRPRDRRAGFVARRAQDPATGRGPRRACGKVRVRVREKWSSRAPIRRGRRRGGAPRAGAPAQRPPLWEGRAVLGGPSFPEWAGWRPRRRSGGPGGGVAPRAAGWRPGRRGGGPGGGVAAQAAGWRPGLSRGWRRATPRPAAHRPPPSGPLRLPSRRPSARRRPPAARADRLSSHRRRRGARRR